MSGERKKPGVAFWATVVLVVVLVVAYPLSIGPACWLADRDMLPELADKPIEIFYSPLMWIVRDSETAGTIYVWYVGLWVPESDAEPLAPAA